MPRDPLLAQLRCEYATAIAAGRRDWHKDVLFLVLLCRNFGLPASLLQTQTRMVCLTCVVVVHGVAESAGSAEAAHVVHRAVLCCGQRWLGACACLFRCCAMCGMLFESGGRGSTMEYKLL